MELAQLYDLFQYAFMQRALLVGVFLAIITGFMGIFVTMRNAAFFGDAVAHSSLAGVALGLFFHINPIITAYVYATAMAFVLPWMRRVTKLSFDTILGIFLPLSMGLGVVIFSLLPGYQPDLLSYLFGSMVSITWIDVYIVIVVSLVLCVIMGICASQFIFVSLDSEYARLIRINTRLYDALFYVLLALVIITGVQLVGIVLINALIVIPASIVKLHARSLRHVCIATPFVSLSAVLMGLVISALWNTPSGASIAVVLGVLFLLSLGVRYKGKIY